MHTGKTRRDTCHEKQRLDSIVAAARPAAAVAVIDHVVFGASRHLHDVIPVRRRPPAPATGTTVGCRILARQHVVRHPSDGNRRRRPRRSGRRRHRRVDPRHAGAPRFRPPRYGRRQIHGTDVLSRYVCRRTHWQHAGPVRRRALW